MSDSGNKKVFNDVQLVIEHLEGVSTKTNKPYDLLVASVIVDGATIKARIDDSVLNLLFNK